jgi:hypothetical protein
MHQFFDGQGGTTVCQPDINVDALFGGVTQWARSLGVYALPHHHIISPCGRSLTGRDVQ